MSSSSASSSFARRGRTLRAKCVQTTPNTMRRLQLSNHMLAHTIPKAEVGCVRCVPQRGDSPDFPNRSHATTVLRKFIASAENNVKECTPAVDSEL